MNTSDKKICSLTNGLVAAAVSVFFLFCPAIQAGMVLTGFEYTWAYNSGNSNFEVHSPDPLKDPGSWNGNVNSGTWSMNMTNQTFNLNVSANSSRTYMLKPKSGVPLTITDNGLGSGVAIRAKVNAQYGDNYAQIFKLEPPSGGPNYFFMLGTNKVGFVQLMKGQEYSPSKTITYNATSGFTTYELYLTYNYAQLYIDGILVIDNVPKATGGDNDRIEFGVLAAGQGDGKGAGDVSYEYVKWGNNMALVPEPSGAALIFLGIFGVLLTRRCRRATTSLHHRS